MNEKKQAYLRQLQKSSIFCNLSEADLSVLVKAMFYCEFEAGQALVYEHEIGSELFIIGEGSVSVSVMAAEDTIQLSVLYPGDFFGEIALLEQAPRSASCIALEDTVCLVLKEQDFSKLIVDSPAIASTVLKNMLSITTERLLHTDGLLSQIVRWGADAKERAITDSFTGLLNRRYLEDAFNTLVSRGGGCLAMVDIDHFGSLNAAYGAEFCDAVLLDIVAIFKEHAGVRDYVIRYGGDEFCFIFSASLPNATATCKKICKAVRELSFPTQTQLKVSVSIGLSPWKQDVLSALLEKADQALYNAKAAGRSCVRVHE